MMGRTHCLSGATGWAATCSLAPLAGVHPHWPAVAAGLLSTAGAALLPDLDHPEATASHTFGPVSHAFTRIVHRVSGGHRHATHSLAFAVLVPLSMWLGDVLGGRWFASTVLFVLFAFAARALHLARGLAPAVGTALSVVVYLLLPDLSWLPWSVAAGILAHLAGDCLTKEGCPLLWPHSAHYMIPIVQRTGNRMETLLFAPLFTLGTVALLAFAR
jgi:membrane-bound metal-dependent hydrolase YbcI (DUF457 family)